MNKKWSSELDVALISNHHHHSYQMLIVFFPCSLSSPGSADKTVKFWDLETFELIGSAGPEVSNFIIPDLFFDLSFHIRCNIAARCLSCILEMY